MSLDLSCEKPSEKEQRLRTLSRTLEVRSMMEEALMIGTNVGKTRCMNAGWIYRPDEMYNIYEGLTGNQNGVPWRQRKAPRSSKR